jgi:polyisoprenoid-binding protein YceI
VSTRVHLRRGGGLHITGDLSIKGVTRSVVLDASPLVPAPDRAGASRVRVSATSSLSRKHFELVWSKLVETAGAVGDVVKISLQLELVEAALPAPHQPIP